jgi:hypothetical protein
MKAIRINLAAGLMFGVLSFLGTAQAFAANRAEVRYSCDGDRGMVVSRSRSIAEIHFIDRIYWLDRRRSSLGERYSSADAAFIVDGTSAAFVAGDHPLIGKCVEVGPTKPNN